MTASNYNSSIIVTQLTNDRDNINVNMGTSATVLKTTSSMSANAQILFYPAYTSLRTKALMLAGNLEGSTGQGYCYGGFEYNATDGVRGFRLSASSGTFSDCDISCSVLSTESAG